MPGKSTKLGTEARKVPLDVKRLVLHESGYKCSNPACRYPLTLEVHHLYYVSEGGGDSAENLLPLCPNCHTEHHHGHIPAESLRAWKMLLLALNEAFDRRAIDLLLTLAKMKDQTITNVTGDGLPAYSALVASGLVASFPALQTTGGWDGNVRWQELYKASLTDKGKLFVEGWKKGDQRAAIELPSERKRGHGRKRGQGRKRDGKGVITDIRSGTERSGKGVITDIRGEQAHERRK